MFKTYRFLTIIALFFFVVSCGGGPGGGGGSGGETSGTISSEPTPPPPQTSTTDESGQASFLTSQGQVVTFEVRDEETGEPLPDISVAFSEEQNNTIIAMVEDSLGNYIPAIYADSLPTTPQNQTADTQIIRPQLVLEVVTLSIGLYKGGTIIGEEIGGMMLYNDLIKDKNRMGITEDIRCISVLELAELIIQTRKDGKQNIIDGGLELVNFAIPTGGSLGGEILKESGFIVLDEILSRSRETVAKELADDYYKRGIIREPSIYETVPVQIAAVNRKGLERFIEKTIYKSFTALPIEYCENIVRPLPPENLRAKPVSSTQIDLSWDDTRLEGGYIIEYSLNGTDFKPVPVCVGKDVTSFSHQFLSPNTTYYYRIYAENSAGSSGYSNITQAKTLGLQNQNPVISSITANPLPPIPPNGTSTLTCNASDPDGDNLIYLWNVSGGRLSDSRARVTIWTAPSTAGTYTVTCSVSDGKPGGTASRSAILTVTEPTTPLSITTTSLTSGTVGVSYATNLSATGGKTPYTWSIISGSLPSGLSLSTGGLISGTPTTAGTYSFTVQVRDSSSPQQTASKALSIVVNPASVSPPASPSNLSATALSQSVIVLVWQDNSNNETGFKIERKTGTTGTFSQIATVSAISGTGSGGYYENSGLTAGTTYCYRIRAYNSAGDSSYSNERCATTNASAPLPTAITGSATNTTSNSATLNGTVNPNGVSTGAFFQYGTSTAYGYTIPYPGINVGSGTSNVNVSANLTGLLPNTTYYFRIVATNSYGGTVFGTNQTFTTSASCSLPGSFTISANAYCKNQTTPAVMITGINSSGMSTFDLYRNGSLYSPSNTGTSFDNSANVVAGQTYTYYVVAKNSCGSTQSNTVTVTVPSNVCSTVITNRLLNPGFESGAVSWGQYSCNPPTPVIGNFPGATAHSGSWYAWMGSVNNCIDYIYQNATIPANATQAYVQFWYAINTSETSTTSCYDKMMVEIRRSSDNTLLTTLSTVCNYTNGSYLGWVQSSQLNVLAYKGQTIRLRFYSITDGSYPTSFFVDDVALMADGN
jgi:hypothetical protein